MCPRFEYQRRPARAGFTLAETMVAASLIGVAMLGVLPFFLQNYRTLFKSEQKLLINADVRKFTNEMMEHARAANYFALYDAFYSRTRRGGARARRDANENGVVNAADRRAAGQGGEFLVFVYYEDPYFDARLFDGDPDNNDIAGVRVTRLLAYWLAPHRDDDRKLALYTIDSDAGRSDGATSWTTPWGATLPATLSSATTLESLLPPATLSAAQSASASLVLQDVDGLGPDGACFVNYLNRSVQVRARILHGNQVKRVTSTYNFTVTPRG